MVFILWVGCQRKTVGSRGLVRSSTSDLTHQDISNALLFMSQVNPEMTGLIVIGDQHVSTCLGILAGLLVKLVPLAIVQGDDSLKKRMLVLHTIL